MGVNRDISLRFKIGNSVVKAEYGDDAAILPEFRDHGLFSDMFRIRDIDRYANRVSFFYSVPLNSIGIDSHQRRGYFSLPFEISHMKFKDVDQYLEVR